MYRSVRGFCCRLLGRRSLLRYYPGLSFFFYGNTSVDSRFHVVNQRKIPSKKEKEEANHVPGPGRRFFFLI